MTPVKVFGMAPGSGIAFLLIAAAWSLITGPVTGPADADALSDDAIAQYSRALIIGDEIAFTSALTELGARGNPDIAAALILALRYNRPGSHEISSLLQEITGHNAETWFDWMVWHERHPEIDPHPSFFDLKLEILGRIDSNFLRFLGNDRGRPDRLHLRLEEITWGGVTVDGIPSLDNPQLIDADKAGYLRADDLVFGVEIDGDARAYPLRILGWHEMVNDVVGGVSVALAYCTLCGAGIL
ncbi:MAG: DUF3179 domain-containing protein [Hyphomicrobiales bacterium]|nr:DUF3179 domain-containing protein [Hyphomicrobiales bacterium]